jgi:hypothetical protein
MAAQENAQSAWRGPACEIIPKAALLTVYGGNHGASKMIVTISTRIIPFAPLCRRPSDRTESTGAHRAVQDKLHFFDGQ